MGKLLKEEINSSPIALGFWRLKEWNLTPGELIELIRFAIDNGITTFDHADIYGNYECEALFGNALKLNPQLRNSMQLVTKCGIKLLTPKYPHQKIKYYDTGYNHIINSVNKSLKNLHTDFIDLLLIHRPDPLMNPEETANAFIELKKSGKVKQFGVSNFSSSDFEMLQAYLPFQLVTNQIELSPYHLDHFQNGDLSFLLKEKIRPMAWSPLAGGKLAHPVDEKERRIHWAAAEVAEKMNVPVDTIFYAWLMNHPSGIIPILGTGKKERIINAILAFELKMEKEDWFKIYIAGTGQPLP